MSTPSPFVWALCTIALVGGILNCNVIYTFCKKKKQNRSNADRLILSLAFADIIFCLGIMVANVVQICGWCLPYQPVEVYFFLSQGTSICASLMNIMGITIDRLVAVVCPIRYKNGYISSKSLNLAIIAIWAFSCLVASTQFWLPLYVIDIFVSSMIFLAFASATTVYIIIGRSVYKSAVALKTESKEMCKRVLESRNMIYMCAFLTLAFFCCNAPFIITNLYLDITDGVWTVTTAQIIYSLLTMNCIIDALLYSFAGRVIKLFKRRTIKRRNTQSSYDKQLILSQVHPSNHMLADKNGYTDKTRVL